MSIWTLRQPLKCSINDAGVPLSQADFAMSKIAADTDHDGQHLRKTIDYFCHLAVAPHFIKSIERNDERFVVTEEFRAMKWLQNEKEDLYDPVLCGHAACGLWTGIQTGEASWISWRSLSGRNLKRAPMRR